MSATRSPDTGRSIDFDADLSRHLPGLGSLLMSERSDLGSVPQFWQGRWTTLCAPCVRSRRFDACSSMCLWEPLVRADRDLPLTCYRRFWYANG